MNRMLLHNEKSELKEYVSTIAHDWYLQSDFAFTPRMSVQSNSLIGHKCAPWHNVFDRSIDLSSIIPFYPLILWKKWMYSVLLSILMLFIPKYVLFNNLELVNSLWHFKLNLYLSVISNRFNGMFKWNKQNQTQIICHFILPFKHSQYLIATPKNASI